MNMSPHVVITIDDVESPTVSGERNHENRSPRHDSTPPRNGGRILYCRKCEGHGEKVILKNHAPSCPYILCSCRSCERLNQKRLKSFNKRNAEKLQLAAALTEQRRRQRELDNEEGPARKISSCSSISSTMDSEPSSSRSGLEGRSMSLGAMTVMSYDIWKAKCAAEKKRLEAEGKTIAIDIEKDKELAPIIRKRAHTYMAQTAKTQEIPKLAPPNVSEKKGRYILLPTIPAMKVFVDEEDMDTRIERQLDSKPATAPASPQAEPMIVSPTPVKPVSLPVTTSPVSASIPPATLFQTPTTQIPMSTPLSRPQTIPFAPPATTSPLLTPDQILGMLQPQAMLLQNTILQQQNAALQQLLGLTMPITTSAPNSQADLLSLLRCQQMANLMSSQSPTGSEEVLQHLLAGRLPNSGRQPIYSHSM